jgi:hypothetical protein
MKNTTNHRANRLIWSTMRSVSLCRYSETTTPLIVLIRSLDGWTRDG